MRGAPQSKMHVTKEDKITELVKNNRIDAYLVMETGIYNKKKPHIPICFDKVLANNVIAQENKHQTPMGAGTLIWANNKTSL